MTIDKRNFKRKIIKQINIGYQLFLPMEYDAIADKKWPLILFLHGIKKRGEDLSTLDGYGLTAIAESSEYFDFIVVTPQCSSYSNWPLERDAVLALLTEIIATYRVDPERIYLTGFSMGGNGAWDLAAHCPELFAAVAPLSGWYQPEAAPLLKDIPIWTFHGEDDDVIPIQKTEVMVQALKHIGGNIQFTTYPGLKHNVMSETYNNPKLYEWFMKHKKQLSIL